MLSAFVTWSLLPLVLADTQLRVLHRVYLPLTGPVPFTERGKLHITDAQAVTASFTPSKTVSQDLQRFAEVLYDIGQEDALYQVALEREDDPDDGHWDISSVKMCLLPQTVSDSFVFHVTYNGKAFALDYFVAPTPHDGSCPSLNNSIRPKWPVLENTTVSLRYPSLPPLPELRLPPPLSPEGEPMQPVPEKTFIQKYWLYMIAFFLAIVLAFGPPEEEGGGGGRK